MAKQDSKSIKRHADTQKLLKLLSEHGISVNENSVIALNYIEGKTDAYISVNYTSTGIHVTITDYDLKDLNDDGIKIWATWTWHG